MSQHWLRTHAATTARWGLGSVFVVAILAGVGQAQEPRFFPKNGIGGFADFAFAPPHNEWDLNRCSANAGAAANGGVNAPCTAFARWALGGHFEVVPFSFWRLRRLSVFAAPRFFFGDNLPQTLYTASFQAIGLEMTTGLRYELPRGFEVLLISHEKMHWFGKYQGTLGAADFRGDGPYGQYNSIDVRWKFGSFNTQRHE